MVFSVNATALVSNVSNVHFEGIIVWYSQGSGMVSTGDNITIVRCSSSHHGAIGIFLTCSGNTIKDSVVHDVGCAGMSVQSEDRPTLTPGNTMIQGNTLHDFSLWKRMYQPGIDFSTYTSNLHKRFGLWVSPV